MNIFEFINIESSSTVPIYRQVIEGVEKFCAAAAEGDPMNEIMANWGFGDVAADAKLGELPAGGRVESVERPVGRDVCDAE